MTRRIIAAALSAVLLSGCASIAPPPNPSVPVAPVSTAPATPPASNTAFGKVCSAVTDASYYTAFLPPPVPANITAFLNVCASPPTDVSGWLATATTLLPVIAADIAPLLAKKGARLGAADAPSVPKTLADIAAARAALNKSSRHHGR